MATVTPVAENRATRAHELRPDQRRSMYASAMLRSLCVIVVVAGCARNARRDEAVARANAARAKGDYVGEALALRDACNAAPDDRDLCRRAVAAWGAAKDRTRQRAAAACAEPAGDRGPAALAWVDGCLQAVSEIRALTPDDAEAARLAEVAARHHLARCFADAPAWQTTIEAAVELVRCEDARSAAIALPLYRQQVWSARVNARDQLVRIAEHPAYADKLGATAELLASAACLTPTPEQISLARGARAAFVTAQRGSLDLRAATPVALPDLCETTVAALDGRATCGAPRGNAPRITIVGEVTIAPVEHAAYETTESKDYVAGIIRFENPEYRPAVDNERSARHARDRAEAEFRRDEADCRSAESALSAAGADCASSCSERDARDRACNRKSASESIYDQRRRDWEDANRRMANTPPISEREDIRTATYTVRHHTWRTTWSAQLRNDGRTLEVGGETTTGDLETAGAPVAGVPADPRTYPGNRWFVPAVRDQLAARLAEITDAALRRRASDLAVSCPAPVQWTTDWLDCWARVRLWGGAPADADALLGELGAEHDQRDGKRWEPVRCAR